MSLTLCSTAFADSETATSPFPAADAKGVITLTSDVTLTTTYVVNGDTTIDLNGHKITGNNCRAIWVKTGTLTLTGTGTVTSIKDSNGSSFAETSSVIRVGDDGTTNNGAAGIVIESGVTVSTNCCYGVTVFDKGNDTLTAKVYGKITAATMPALGGNGTKNWGNVTFDVYEGAEITSTSSPAIYHPQAGTLNVNGGTITGATGIEMRAGTLNVSGGTIKATGTYKAPIANTSGTTTVGAAIAVVEHTTQMGVTVNLNGGTVTAGENAMAIVVSDPHNSGADDVKVTVNGSTVFGGLVQETSVGRNTPISVKSGAFTDLASAMTYATNGATIKLANDITMSGAKVEAGHDFTVDFDSKTVTLGVPAVGSEGTETNGFQLLKGSDITFKNGTIKVSADNLTEKTKKNSKGEDVNNNIQHLFQNYSNLTLENMTLDGTYLYGTSSKYVVSNCCGTTNITGNTSITAPEGGVAFDVYYWANESYSEGLTVNVNTTGTIKGTIELAASSNASNYADKAKLNITNINHVGDIVKKSDATVVVTGGTFTSSPAAYLPATGYAVTYNGSNYVANEKKNVDAGATGDNKTSVVEIETGKMENVSIPSAAIEADKELTVNGTDGTNKVSVTLNAAAVNQVAEAGELELTVTTKEAKNNTNVDEANKDAYANATKNTATTNAVVVTIDLKSDGNNVFTGDTTGAYAIVKVPYKAGMKDVTVTYLAAGGSTTTLDAANSANLTQNNTFYYDSTTGDITMRLPHFSQYLINGSVQRSYINRYNNGAVTTDKAESPKTFDAGVAIYGVMAVSSVLGMGYMGKKKFF